MALSPTFVAPGTTYRSFCDPTKHAEQTNADTSQSDRTSPFLGQDSLFVKRCLSPSTPWGSSIVIKKEPVQKKPNADAFRSALPDPDTLRSALKERLLNPVATESHESKAQATLQRAKASVRENLDALGKTPGRPTQAATSSFRAVEVTGAVPIQKPKNSMRFIPVGSYQDE